MSYIWVWEAGQACLIVKLHEGERGAEEPDGHVVARATNGLLASQIVEDLNR